MYPDRHADQSSAGVRHKALLSLKGFSGLQVLNKMDKHFNVIVIITTEEVIPLSFETIDQRAEWLALLQGHFGKGEPKSMMTRICKAQILKQHDQILFTMIVLKEKKKMIICICIQSLQPLHDGKYLDNRNYIWRFKEVF